MTKTTIDIFLNMNQDYQRLVLTKIFELVPILHQQTSALKTKTGDIKYNFMDIDENNQLAKQKLMSWEEAEAVKSDKISDIKTLNKERIPYINRAHELADALLKICTSPKETAIFYRQKELNEK